jgi:hypothetical protein
MELTDEEIYRKSILNLKNLFWQWESDNTEDP